MKERGAIFSKVRAIGIVLWQIMSSASYSDALHAQRLTVRLSLAAWRTDVEGAEFFSPAARGATGRSMLWWTANSSPDRIPRCSLSLLDGHRGWQRWNQLITCF